MVFDVAGSVGSELFNPGTIKTYKFKHRNCTDITERTDKVRLTFCITYFMGDFKLYQQQSSPVRIHDALHVIYRSSIGILDDIGSNLKKMNTALVALTLLGIPCGIYAYYLDVNPQFDLVKGIILLAIGGATGLVLLGRYVVKLLTEWQEYKRKYVNRK